MRHSLRDLPLMGTRGGDGSNSCCRGGQGLPLANSSLIYTRSSSLEMMSGEVPPVRSDSSAQAYLPCFLGPAFPIRGYHERVIE